MIYVISNVGYPEDQRLHPEPNDLLVFLNKARSIDYYPEHRRKICIRRSPEVSYGTDIPGTPSFFIYAGPKHKVPPNKILAEIKSKYDWDYEVAPGDPKSATTGYMAVKCLEKRYPGEEIVLVNFGYKVKNSSYRCPWHNWQFEDKALAKYKHIYTAATTDDCQSINVVYCCDEKYTDLLILSAKSVLKYNPTANITVVSEKSLTLPKPLVNIVYPLDKLDLFTTEHLSRAAYLRLFLPKILEDYDKVIYLDCDTLCKGTLDDLWLTPIKYIGATHSHNTGIYQAREMHVNVYYLSSMLVMNLAALRKLGFADICAFTIKHVLLADNIRRVCDEGILNVVFNKYIEELPIRWNYCLNRSYNAYPTSSDTLSTATIIHYIGGQTQQMIEDSERMGK